MFLRPGQRGKIKLETAMPLRVRVESRWLDELLSYLRSLGADVRKERDAIIVRRTHRALLGEPLTQDQIELEFVVRGWASDRPGVTYEIERAA
jgi:hypothetical protein